jgi:hypothetical protein
MAYQAAVRYKCAVCENRQCTKPHVNIHIYIKHKDRKSVVESWAQSNDYINFTFGFIILELY